MFKLILLYNEKDILKSPKVISAWRGRTASTKIRSLLELWQRPRFIETDSLKQFLFNNKRDLLQSPKVFSEIEIIRRLLKEWSCNTKFWSLLELQQRLRWIEIDSTENRFCPVMKEIYDDTAKKKKMWQKSECSPN